MAIETLNVSGLNDIGFLYPKERSTAAKKEGKRITRQVGSVSGDFKRSTPQAVTHTIETEVSLEEPGNGWKIAQDQFHSPTFKPLIDAGYFPVTPQVRDNDKSSDLNNTVFLWKKDSQTTGKELMDAPFGHNPNPEEAEPAVLAVSIQDIGRDFVEITGDPKELARDCQKGWSSEIDKALYLRFRGKYVDRLAEGSVVLPDVDSVIQAAQRDHSHHVKARNYLTIVQDMKEKGAFPPEWDWQKRKEKWECEQNRQQTVPLPDKKTQIPVNAKPKKVPSLHSAFSPDASLELSAIQFATQIGLEPDRLPKKILKKYVRLRNNGFTQTNSSPTSPQCDERIFADALEQSAMHNKATEFKKLYPNIFGLEGKPTKKHSIQKKEVETAPVTNQPQKASEGIEVKLKLLIKAAESIETDLRYPPEKRKELVQAYKEQVKILIDQSI